jgi:hypothetical protein
MEESYLSIQKKTHHFSSLHCFGVFDAPFLGVVTCTFQIRSPKSRYGRRIWITVETIELSRYGSIQSSTYVNIYQFCIDPDESTLFVKKTFPLRGSLIANSVSSAFKSKNPPVSPTWRHGMFKEFSTATYQPIPWATTKVKMLHVSWLYVLNTFIHKCIVVARLGWKVVIESPDKMASLTTTNIFCENAQVEEWADELKSLLMGTTGIGFGKLTTCFFSNCCGYTYAHKSVIPSKIPSVLRRMMGVLMPVCGLSRSRVGLLRSM